MDLLNIYVLLHVLLHANTIWQNIVQMKNINTAGILIARPKSDSVND